MSRRRSLFVPCSCALALVLAACGSSTSTSNFKGAEHEVAQRISNFQSDATSSSRSNICTKDLAGPLVTRLGGRKACEAAVKSQLGQVDNLEVTIKSVKLAPDGKSATATVKSTENGKTRVRTVALVKEGGAWRLSAP
jgi:hypothetical protein